MTLVRRCSPAPCSPRCSSSAASTRSGTPSRTPPRRPVTDRMVPLGRSERCRTCPRTPRRSCGSTRRSRSAAGPMLATRPVPAALLGACSPAVAGADDARRAPVLGGDGPGRRKAQQRIHFFKNVSMLGGLMHRRGRHRGTPGPGLAGPPRRAATSAARPGVAADARREASWPRRGSALSHGRLGCAARTTLAGMIAPWPAPRAPRAGRRRRCRLPGTKSLTNRALVLAALADGPASCAAPLRSPRHRADGRRRCARWAPASTTSGDGLAGRRRGALDRDAAVDCGLAGHRDALPAAGGRAGRRRRRLRRRPALRTTGRSARCWPRCATSASTSTTRPRRAAVRRSTAAARCPAAGRRSTRRASSQFVSRAAARRRPLRRTASRCATTASRCRRCRTST